MKTKTTKREIRAHYPNIISLGYCEMPSLLARMEPRWYTCGIYGWYADIYEVNPSTVIVTGYQPFGTRPKESRKFEKIAESVISNFKIPYEEQCAILENLLAEFVAENVK